MKKMLILGIGNRLMMDDGIGVYVVEELKKRSSYSGIRYVIGETDIYFCLDYIEKASYIIIVDAAFLGKEPGSISEIPFEQIKNHPLQTISVHDSHLLDDIRIRGNDIDGVFIGIEPQEVNYCQNLSQKLQEQFIKIVEETERIISIHM
jgi:hydrogenase maturation protease